LPDVIYIQRFFVQYGILLFTLERKSLMTLQ